MSGKNDTNNSGKKSFRFGFGKKNTNNQSKNDSHVPAATPQKLLEIRTYLANPKAYVYTHNMSMASRLLTVKLDHHLQYKETCVPVVKQGPVTWDLLEQHNQDFQELRKTVEELQNQCISEHSLNIIAERVVNFVTKKHQLKPVAEPASVE